VGVLAVGVVVAVLAVTLLRSSQQLVANSTTTVPGSSLSSTTATSAQTTTTALESTTSTVAASSNTIPLSTTVSSAAPASHPGEFVVVIDPGHQAKANYNQEPIGPGSSETKAKVSSGTRSINTGTPESQLVLAVSLKLRDSLEAQGIRVVMTRTTQDVDVSNIQRAQIANTAGADLFVRIHADGAGETTTHGILMLYPATITGWTDDIAVASKRAAQIALECMVAATGAPSRGLSARRDLSGFNWSDVPVILPEIGLMTNREEDALLATGAYQDKLVQGLTDAVLEFLGAK
jgi:N-acetylmuramoyl-L-alanine amidase